MKKSTNQPINKHPWILALFTVLALALSWPLAANLTTKVPGVAQWAFDESTFVWNIWTFKQAVVDNLASPLHSELIWYPLGIDLILYTYNFFHALIAQPLALAVNYPFASNIALLFSTVMSGYGTFLLVRYLLNGEWRMANGEAKHGLTANGYLLPAILAGILYAFASNRAIYATLGHYDMVTTQWIPLYALTLLRSLDGKLSPARRRKAAILAGIFFAFNGLAEMITAVFLAIFTVIVVIVKIWEGWRRGGEEAKSVFKATQHATRNTQSLLIIGGIAALLWGPALFPILKAFMVDNFALKGWGEAIPLSTDLLGWFKPTVLHPFFGGDLVSELRRVQLRALELGVTGPRDVNTVFLGWTSAALALVGVLAFRKRVRIWVWTTLVFGLFTLGPFLQIDGNYRFDLDGVEATFPLPFAILHYLPIIKANRAPNRNSVLLMLGLAVLAGYGVAWIMRKVANGEWQMARGGRRFAVIGIPVVLAVAVIFEHLALPLPLSDARIPAVYAQIQADPRPVSVFNVPLGWRNSFGTLGPEQTQLQYFQIGHGKPMLGGNISRAPDFKMDYFARIPYFDTLLRVEEGQPLPPEATAQAAAQTPDLMALYNVGYVLLHPPIEQRYPYADTWQASWDFVKATLPLEPTPFWTGGGIEAYRVVLPPVTDSFRLDLGTPGTFAYRGEGWDAAEVDEPFSATAIWATEPESRLFIPLANRSLAATYRVTAHVHPFAYGGPTQSVALTVNGTVLSSQPLTDSWQEITWYVPGSLLIDGLNHFDLQWAELAVPRQVIPGSRQIGSTGVNLPVDADIKAFADGAFIALFDESGTQSDGSAGRQGINLTVLDPATGEVTAMQGFDTTANAFESESLAAFVADIPPGTPVIVASRGNATAFLSADGVTALRTLGADVSAERLAGQFFAIVGVKDAAPGSAAQVIDPADAFLRVSLNRDRRTLAGAVDWVEVGK
ncbi:MAG: hypothetical protein KA003_19790 [Caldilineaceae bacterium]|nr:hypothetical protein [Caldilineaceae bacterium]MBP8109318.1 hypothetical protein [Caldilineaceae bacterium]MBP8124382.1 hypothetical protein [Caldilineaceae bacterium]